MGSLGLCLGMYLMIVGLVFLNGSSAGISTASLQRFSRGLEATE